MNFIYQHEPQNTTCLFSGHNYVEKYVLNAMGNRRSFYFCTKCGKVLKALDPTHEEGDLDFAKTERQLILEVKAMLRKYIYHATNQNPS